MPTKEEVKTAPETAADKAAKEAAKNAPTIVVGKKTKLSAMEQGQLARGEIDKEGEPVNAAVVPVKKVVGEQVEKTLYKGTLSGESISDITGEKISFRWEQSEPATLDGCFYTFQCMHGPGANREAFKLDTENKIDPTLRTHLE